VSPSEEPPGNREKKRPVHPIRVLPPVQEKACHILLEKSEELVEVTAWLSMHPSDEDLRASPHSETTGSCVGRARTVFDGGGACITIGQEFEDGIVVLEFSDKVALACFFSSAPTAADKVVR